MRLMIFWVVSGTKDYLSEIWVNNQQVSGIDQLVNYS